MGWMDSDQRTTAKPQKVTPFHQNKAIKSLVHHLSTYYRVSTAISCIETIETQHVTKYITSYVRGPLCLLRR